MSMENFQDLKKQYNENYLDQLSEIVNDNKKIISDKFQLLRNYISFLNEFCENLKTFIETEYSNRKNLDEKNKFLHKELPEENFLKTTKEMYLDKIIENELFKEIDLNSQNQKVNTLSWAEEVKELERGDKISIFKDLKDCEKNINSVLTLRGGDDIAKRDRVISKIFT